MSISSSSILNQTLIEKAGHVFPHPFFDISSQYVPQEIRDALKWAEFMYLRNTMYKSATDRIVRYGITEIAYKGEPTQSTEKYKELLEEHLHVKSRTIESSTDLLVYGNTFNSMHFPFDRFGVCTQCKLERPIDDVDYKYTSGTGDFHAKCPCGYSGKIEVRDKRSRDLTRVKIIRWSPHQMDIKSHPISGEMEYYWKIPEDFVKRIQEGDQFYINSTPMAILQAVQQKKMFKFNRGQVFHRTLSTLAGVSRDWGLPPCLTVFTLYWYTAILRRANEAIAFDYIIPFRVLFPQGSSANNDPTHFIAMGTFLNKMQEMVKLHRRDPAHVQVSPIPVGYEAMGAEGKSLDTSPLIKQTNEEILNALGYPAELFYGTLSIQAMPAALRLFENMWRDLHESNDDLLQWIADRSAQYFDWEDQEVDFTPVTLADDIEKRQVIMQLSAAQQISSGTMLSQWGLDFKDELKKRIEEQQIAQEIQTKAQEEATSQAQAQGAQGGAGSGTIFDLQTQAQQTAQQLLSIPDDGQRRSQMQMIAQQDESMYALVKMYMDRFRGQANSQAGRDAMQQGLFAAGQGGVTGGGLQPPGQPAGVM